MAVKLRLARWGAKKKPYYHIVAADARSPRDGKFLETVGKYNPMLDHENEQRVTLKIERIKYWLSTGAIPTDRVYRILTRAGLVEAKPYPEQTKKNKPKAKAAAKLQAEADKLAAAESEKNVAKAEEKSENTEEAITTEKEVVEEKTVAKEAVTEEAPAVVTEEPKE